MPGGDLGITGWRTLEASKKDRDNILSISIDKTTPSSWEEEMKASVGKIFPTSTWKKCEGTFTLLPTTKRFIFRFGVHGKPGAIKLGTKLYIDDVCIYEADKGPEANICINPGGEE